MLYVKITKEEALKVGANNYGIASGKKNKETGIRETFHFCSNKVFIHYFDREKEFIVI